MSDNLSQIIFMVVIRLNKLLIKVISVFAFFSSLPEVSSPSAVPPELVPVVTAPVETAAVETAAATAAPPVEFAAVETAQAPEIESIKKISERW